jgi:uncharacterized membrane protein YhaH (DUF805 family)
MQQWFEFFGPSVVALIGLLIFGGESLDFTGRYNIKEYWVRVVGAFLFLLFGMPLTYRFLPLGSVVVFLVAQWVLLASLVKRFHDAGRSRWLSLWVLFPGFGLATYVIAGALPDRDKEDRQKV